MNLSECLCSILRWRTVCAFARTTNCCNASPHKLRCVHHPSSNAHGFCVGSFADVTHHTAHSPHHCASHNVPTALWSIMWCWKISIMNHITKRTFTELLMCASCIVEKRTLQKKTNACGMWRSRTICNKTNAAKNRSWPTLAKPTWADFSELVFWPNFLNPKKKTNPKHLNPKPWERGPTFRVPPFGPTCSGFGVVVVMVVVVWTPPPDRPKFRAFSSLSRHRFVLTVSLWVSSCSILVVFLKAGTLKCPRLGSRAVVWNPSGFGAAGASRNNPTTPNVRPPRRFWARPFWAPPFFAPPFGAPPSPKGVSSCFFFLGERKKALRLNHKFGPKWVNTFKH